MISRLGIRILIEEVWLATTDNNRELTAEDAAKVLKVHSRTIRNMIAKKEIRGKKVGGGRGLVKYKIWFAYHL